MKRRIITNLTAISLLCSLIFILPGTHLAGAKDPDYPTKPITFFISMAAGGSTDLAARGFIEAASKHLEQPLIPINKPGGGGTVATMAVMSAKPDGYTLGQITTSSGITAPCSPEAPYKDLSGLTLIMNYANYICPMMVKDDAPWKNWKEFIEWARKNPRGAKIGIAGAKSVSSQGFVVMQIEKREQVEFTCIPFKSSAEIITATLGGHVSMSMSAVDTTSAQYITEGKLRILTYWGPLKVPGFENIPSTPELYGFPIPAIIGAFGPKGLPDYVLKKLEDAFAKAVKEPNFIKMMDRMYMPVVYMNRNQMEKYVEKTLPEVCKIFQEMRDEEAKKKK